jgi:protein TonB
MKKLAYLFFLSLLFAFASQTRVLAQDDQNNKEIKLKHPPTYPGGLTVLYQFLNENIKYPAMAQENNVQGEVKVSFTVEKNGDITNVAIEKGLGYGIDQEAIRVVKLMKKWNPGKLKGKPISVSYSLPINFSLTKN